MSSIGGRDDPVGETAGSSSSPIGIAYVLLGVVGLFGIGPVCLFGLWSRPGGGTVYLLLILHYFQLKLKARRFRLLHPSFKNISCPEDPRPLASPNSGHQSQPLDCPSPQ